MSIGGEEEKMKGANQSQKTLLTVERVAGGEVGKVLGEIGDGY